MTRGGTRDVRFTRAQPPVNLFWVRPQWFVTFDKMFGGKGLKTLTTSHVRGIRVPEKWAATGRLTSHGFRP